MADARRLSGLLHQLRLPRLVDQVEHRLLDAALDRRLADVGLLRQVDQHRLDREALPEAVEDARVYICRACDRGGIAEEVRDLLHRVADHPLVRGLDLAPLRVGGCERDGGQHRSGPRAELLRRVLVAGRLLHVGTDVRGLDVAPLAVVVAVGEELVASPAAALQLADDLGHRLVDHVADVADPALAGEVEVDRVVRIDRDVLLAHRRQAVRIVVLGVALAADPQEAAIEQTDGGGENARPGDAVAGQIALDLVPHVRQRLCEANHRVELLAILPLAPFLVVQVLLAPGVVHAGCLDVAQRVRADPDVLPRGRDSELGDPLEDLRIGDAATLRVEVLEALAAPAAGQAGTGAVGSPETSHGMRVCPHPPGSNPRPHTAPESGRAPLAPAYPEHGCPLRWTAWIARSSRPSPTAAARCSSWADPAPGRRTCSRTARHGWSSRAPPPTASSSSRRPRPAPPICGCGSRR